MAQHYDSRPVDRLDDVRNETASTETSDENSTRRRISPLVMLGYAAYVAVVLCAAGCVGRTKRKEVDTAALRDAYAAYFEGDYSFIDRNSDGEGEGDGPNKGADVKMLDFDGITRIDFYDGNNLLASVTNLRALIEIGIWSAEGCGADGRVIHQSSELPLDEPFENYHLTRLHGHDINFRGVNPTNITVRVYDKNGNERIVR